MFNLKRVRKEKEKSTRAILVCFLFSLDASIRDDDQRDFFCIYNQKNVYGALTWSDQITEIAFENSFRPGYNFFFALLSISMPSPSFDCLHVAFISLIALLIKHRLCDSSSSSSRHSTLRLHRLNIFCRMADWAGGLSYRAREKYEIIMQ